MLKAKKKEEVIKEVKGIDYNKWDTNFVIKTIVKIAVFAIGTFVGYIIYNIILVAIIFGVISVPIGFRLYEKKKIENRKLNFRTQFKEFLNFLNVSLKAGVNNELHALKGSTRELSLLFPLKNKLKLSLLVYL